MFSVFFGKERLWFWSAQCPGEMGGGEACRWCRAGKKWIFIGHKECVWEKGWSGYLILLTVYCNALHQGLPYTVANYHNDVKDWEWEDHRSNCWYQPYTLVGPPVWRLVLDPLAVYSSRTIYICYFSDPFHNAIWWSWDCKFYNLHRNCHV